MEKEKDNSNDQGKKRKKKQKNGKSQVPLPYCTTAPDPEHARGFEEEEPCDDGRSGKTEPADEQQEATEDMGSTHDPHAD